MTKGDHKVGYSAEITGVTPVIEDYEKHGWYLHTYPATCLSDEVAQLNQEGEAITSLQQIRDRFSGRLNELTHAE